MEDVFPRMADLVAEGVQGRASVQHVIVDAEGGRTACYVYGEFRNPSPAGTYVSLRVTSNEGESQVMMSDFYYERATCVEIVKRAHGDVLIAGLGVGMILHPILNKREVRSVTVIEKYQDVIDLIKPTLPRDPRLNIIHADIFEWRPPRGTRFDVIWFDIWPDIEASRLPEMSRLHRRFRGYLNRENANCWIESWHRKETMKMTRKQRRAEAKSLLQAA